MTTSKQLASYAESLCGDTGSRYQSMFQASGNVPWSAAFVSSCLNHFDDTSSLLSSNRCSDFEKIKGSDKVQWIPRGKSSPKQGDIMLFNWSSNQTGKVNKVGIVKKCGSSTVDVVLGDCGADSRNSTVAMHTYNQDLTCIQGYIRIKSIQ